MRREAMHYKNEENGSIKCELCPHGCSISEGGRGVCGVREYSEGKLSTLNYGEISSIGIDPIEKKPLYHYKPGSQILSVGSYGCNFSCGFCQNYSISKNMPDTRFVKPEELVKIALEAKNEGNIGIAFTYNEPSIWYEYVYDTSIESKKNNMDVILVTNGFINRGPLYELMPYIDAMNIDLKAFSGKYYREVCHGNIDDVMSTIESASRKCHVEITTLLVNGYNDSDEEIVELSKWLSQVSPDIPLHLSRYYPTYKFTEPATPVDRVKRCAEEARKYLHYVYIGNIMGVDSNTYCYNCGEMLVDRDSHHIRTLMENDNCTKCGKHINITL